MTLYTQISCPISHKMRDHLFAILGYAGALPFILCSALLFTEHGQAFAYNIGFIQIAYGGFVASFLAGVHWCQALKSNNMPQMIFSMIPTILFLIFLIMALLTPLMQAALLASALVFAMLYVIDTGILDITNFPARYMIFRRNITLIVIACFLISALGFTSFG